MAVTTKGIPAEFDTVVKEAIASGRYRSEEEIVTAALRLWREREVKLEKLRQDVQLGIDQLERGEWTEGEEAIRQIKERIAKRKENRGK
jgi:antitoxin ParD1/3/4